MESTCKTAGKTTNMFVLLTAFRHYLKNILVGSFFNWDEILNMIENNSGPIFFWRLSG